MKQEIRSLLSVISANFIILLVGIVQTLTLPNILNPTEYGYWSLFLLYIGYSGIIIIGYCDGFYLKYGGYEYKNIDKELFSSYFYLLLIYLSILLLILIGGISFSPIYLKRKLVYISIGIGVSLTCIISFFTLLNQATGRFSIYAKGHIIEKVLLLIISLVFLFFSINTNCFYIIIPAIIGKIITIVYYAYYSGDIIFKKPCYNVNVFKSSIDNIKIGFILTMSNIGTMLMTGFGRFLIDIKLGIKELGYYSLMFSIAALFTQIIYAISTVFFPIFCRINGDKGKQYLENIDNFIVNIGILILILYYPIRYILQLLYPNYYEAMDCTLFIYPTIIYQCRMTIIYNTIYKIMRWEKQMLRNVFISFILCFFITLLIFFIKPCKESIAFAMFISYYLWHVLTITIYKKKSNSNIAIIDFDILICTIFIISNLYFGFTAISLSISLLSILLFIINRRQKTIKLVKSILAGV